MKTEKPHESRLAALLNVFGVLGILATAFLLADIVFSQQINSINLIAGSLCGFASLGLFAAASIIGRLKAIVFYLEAAHVSEKPIH